MKHKGSTTVNENQYASFNAYHPSRQATQFADAVANINELIQLRLAVKELVFFPRKIAHSQLAGGQRSLFRGRGMDFEEVRHYQPGDDVRAIDWRVTARTETPHTKVFREERERPIFIITDLRRPMLFGSKTLKLDTACKLSAALAWAGINSNDRIGALLFGARQQLTIRPPSQPSQRTEVDSQPARSVR